ncbi:MAG TPA: PEP-CTERM sorting domain-containing protein [Planctomycetota bacterium]|nr:PEP-CTERM sorting domain-containing protein [Planctomycetota bacterium]
MANDYGSTVSDYSPATGTWRTLVSGVQSPNDAIIAPFAASAPGGGLSFGAGDILVGQSNGTTGLFVYDPDTGTTTQYFAGTYFGHMAFAPVTLGAIHAGDLVLTDYTHASIVDYSFATGSFTTLVSGIDNVIGLQFVPADGVPEPSSAALAAMAAAALVRRRRRRGA